MIAESTGKLGKGIIPVDREDIGAPDVYGNDRIFAYLRLETAPDAAQDDKVAALEKAGQPVVQIAVSDIYSLGQEFFRWEIATAVAGSILGINAFNQPDVEASKIVTKQLTSAYESSGSLPPEKPILEEAALSFSPTRRTPPPSPKPPAPIAHSELSACAPHPSWRRRLLCAARLYRDERGARISAAALRMTVRDRKHVATCLGFGPRFLHSTGQAYKGGPNSGVFLQVTCDDAQDLPVPGQKYTFGVGQGGAGSRRL